jgi:hypothetical protein
VGRDEGVFMTDGATVIAVVNNFLEKCLAMTLIINLGKHIPSDNVSRKGLSSTALEFHFMHPCIE